MKKPSQNVDRGGTRAISYSVDLLNPKNRAERRAAKYRAHAGNTSIVPKSIAQTLNFDKDKNQ